MWAPGLPDRIGLETLAAGGAPTADTAALGFARLSILDLGPTGSQPMIATDRAALVLNGEIYNYLELREELRALGWTFNSTGDSEVLLKGWLEWGEGVFARCNGMWAAAIHDTRRDGVLLSRDRFGEKPLFYTDWRGGTAFASEIKQLFRFPDVPVRVSTERAAGYIRSGRSYDGSSSWFEGIHQVEPGESIWVDRAGRRKSRYWSLRDAVAAVEPARDAGAWQERFADAFTESVRLRLRSDVPVGTSLSGGVDSSAVMAEVTALGNTRYHSFTLVSDDRSLNEGPEAESFARSMGSSWHPVEASGAEFASIWDRITWHQEGPVPSTSVYGQWKVMQRAREAGVIVLLDGQGADEILGGYHKFMAAVIVSRLRARDPRAVPLVLAFARQLGSIRSVTTNGFRYLGRFDPSPELRLLKAVSNVPARTPSIRVDPLTMRLADVERWSLPNLLSYVDRNAMAFGVETRLPFLDPEVVALSLAMPPEVLLRHGWSKWPLRQTLSERGGPTPAWRRGKRWFGVPQARWLRGPLAPQVEAWRRAPHPMWADLVDLGSLRGLADAWIARSRPSAAADAKVFELVALDRFFRTWSGD